MPTNGKKKPTAKKKNVGSGNKKFSKVTPINKRKYPDTPAGKLKKKRDAIRAKSAAAYKSRGGKTNVQGGRTFTKGAKAKMPKKKK